MHVSSFQGVGSAIFLASSTGMLYKMKVTLNASKDGRNSSAVSEEVAGHRPHPTHSNEGGPAASARLSCVSSLWSVGSACFIADGGRLRLYTPTPTGNPPQRKMKSPKGYRERDRQHGKVLYPCNENHGECNDILRREEKHRRSSKRT